MEQGLPGWGVCNLGHINLSRFLVKTSDPWNYLVDWDALEKAVRLGVRFQDNLIDITPYFFDENKKVQENERRIGMGTLGLAEMLIRLKLRYGSPESIRFIDDLYSNIAYWAYDESVNLAIEKGAFPKFEAEKYLQSGFMKNMLERFPHLGDRIRKHGIRNVCLLTQAPTGSTGTMHNTSTGIEPYYSTTWWRTSRLGVVQEEIRILSEWAEAHGVELPRDKNGSIIESKLDLPKYFVTAMELSPEDHVLVQGTIQKWTDSSISKTTNAPADYTLEQTATLYEYAYDQGLKGITIYRDSSRDEQVLNLVETEEAEEDEMTFEEYLEEEEEPKVALDENIKAESVNWQHPGYRKRPTRVFGYTDKIRTPIGKLYVTVNMDKDFAPIEVFVRLGKAGQETNAFTEALGKLISVMLKNNIPVQQVTKQLKGIVGSNPWFHAPESGNSVLLKSIPDAVATVIEDYNALRDFVGSAKEVQSGQLEIASADGDTLDEFSNKGIVLKGKVVEIQGDSDGDMLTGPGLCDSCNSPLVRAEGCYQCPSCGWSKCN